jgi:AcrR family transcriptional regulator
MSVRAASSPSRNRQERARQLARREILEAAAGVFARRGYAASTLADLARAAGYAAPSLYRYFSGKEEIFRSLVELVKADLRATFEAPVSAGAPLADRLEGLLAAQFELSRRRREVIAFLLSTPTGDQSQRLAADLRAGASLHERLTADWLRRHARPAELRCPVEDAARALSAVAHAFHQSVIIGPDEGLDSAAVALRVVDLVLHGIAAPAAPGQPAARRGAHP